MIDPEYSAWGFLVLATITLIVRFVLRRRAERANRMRAERSLKQYLNREGER